MSGAVAVTQNKRHPAEIHFGCGTVNEFPGRSAKRARLFRHLLVRTRFAIARRLAGTDMSEISVSHIQTCRPIVAFATKYFLGINDCSRCLRDVIVCQGAK